MSGVSADSGTCPGNAAPTRATSARTAAKRRVISWHPIVAGDRWDLCGCRGPGCWRVAQRQVHDRDLLLLVDDDLLSESSEALVLAVPQLRERHVDGPLMMWDHHASEVAVGITAEGDVHCDVHARHGVRDRQ